MSNNQSTSGPKLNIWRISQVAEYLGVSKGHIYNLSSKGEIPFIKKGKLLYFVPEDIENWLLEGNVYEKAE